MVKSGNCLFVGNTADDIFIGKGAACLQCTLKRLGKNMHSVRGCVCVYCKCVCVRKADGKTNVINVNSLYLFATFLKPQIM